MIDVKEFSEFRLPLFKVFVNHPISTTLSSSISFLFDLTTVSYLYDLITMIDYFEWKKACLIAWDLLSNGDFSDALMIIKILEKEMKLPLEKLARKVEFLRKYNVYIPSAYNKLVNDWKEDSYLDMTRFLHEY